MDPDATGTSVKTGPQSTESRTDSAERIKKGEPNSGPLKASDTSSDTGTTNAEKRNRQEQWHETQRDSNNPAIDGNYNSSDNNNEENNDSDGKNISNSGPNDHFDPISRTSGSSLPGRLDVSRHGYLSREMNKLTTDGKLMEAMSKSHWLTIVVAASGIIFDICVF